MRVIVAEAPPTNEAPPLSLPRGKPRGAPGALRLALTRAGQLVVFLLAAEAASRLEDRVRLGVPLAENRYSHDNLVLRGPETPRGRPHAVYRKWKLNRYGFRGPEIEQEPDPGRTRVMVLGASEAFGLHESERKEFPAQLDAALGRDGGSYEVINAAIPGMTAGSMIRNWEHWSSRFRPQVVVIYASPLFYLNDTPRPAGRPVAAAPERTAPPEFGSRFLGRIREAVELPEFVVRWRRRRLIASLEAAKGPDWFFRSAPEDRLERYLADVRTLISSIRSRDAEPILLTHAIRSSPPLSVEERAQLDGMRSILPRATAEAIVEFESEANRAVGRLGAEQHVETLDVAGALSGRDDCFADLVHFNDRGAAAIAGLVAEGVRRVAPSPATAGRGASHALQ